MNIWYLPISSEILLVMVPKVPEKSFQYSKIRNVEDYQTLKYDRFFMANKTVLSDYRNIVLESTESFVLFINKMFLKRHKEIIVISKNEESLKSLK